VLLQLTPPSALLCLLSTGPAAVALIDRANDESTMRVDEAAAAHARSNLHPPALHPVQKKWQEQKIRQIDGGFEREQKNQPNIVKQT
jgi:hypothetical protein